MLRSQERRRSLRVTVRGNVEYCEAGQAAYRHGQLNNLSTDGILFQTDEAFDVGTVLAVHLSPANTLTPPLDATVEVVRVDTAEDLRHYQIAGRITSTHH